MNKAFPVKDNQKHLSEAIVDFFATAEAFDFRQIDVQKRVTDEKNHGRLETRRALLVTNVSWMDKPMRALWTKQGGVGMLESIQEIKGEQRVERRYFIVSIDIKTVPQFADAGVPTGASKPCTGCLRSLSKRTIIGCVKAIQLVISRLSASSHFRPYA